MFKLDLRKTITPTEPNQLARTSFYIVEAFVVGVMVLKLTQFQVNAQAPLPPNPQTGSTGMQGKISAPAPTVGASISLPANGQTFTSLPINLSGICPNDLLVKVFKNNVFAGSTVCKNGSYSVVIDLFNGRNEIVARVYDALDQTGPESNIVTVTYTDPNQGTASRVSLTSNFAKRGANPGQELVWPITLSGGEGPYALSVDWGDGKPPDLISQQFSGLIEIKHKYDSPGVYNIIVKATDKNKNVAFLQLVGVANGALTGENTSNSSNADTKTEKTKSTILWQPAAAMIPVILSTFWLGKKYAVKALKQKIERGERPF